jgi:hypothetical protein
MRKTTQQGTERTGDEAEAEEKSKKADARYSRTASKTSKNSEKHSSIARKN